MFFKYRLTKRVRDLEAEIESLKEITHQQGKIILNLVESLEEIYKSVEEAKALATSVDNKFDLLNIKESIYENSREITNPLLQELNQQIKGE